MVARFEQDAIDAARWDAAFSLSTIVVASNIDGWEAHTTLLLAMLLHAISLLCAISLVSALLLLAKWQKLDHSLYKDIENENTTTVDKGKGI